ncbi:MASE1 domain-containing protein [Aliinostoc sp. HNIBRCY26]|uniref:MASE1 domain-containing protein n=1 Tax=Aliinostoc sp. HNIBRCY26 TaxID=3418997 RepID=UPI003D05D896
MQRIINSRQISTIGRWLMISLLGLLALIAAHGMALIYRIQPGVSLWFPPSGVAIALTFWFGPCGIILTGIAAFLMSPAWGFHGWERLIALPDMIEPLVAWLFYRYFWQGSRTLNTLKDVAFFIFSVPLIASATLAIVGNLTLVAIDKMSITNLGNSIPHWWLGNAMGIMAITPTALLVITPYLQSHGCLSSAEPLNSSFVSPSFPPSRRFLLEFSTIILLCVAIASLTVAETHEDGFRFQQLSFLSFIPVIWAATRFGVTCGMLISSFCVLVTLFFYLVAYPNAMSLPTFPVEAEVLHVHKLSLLVQCIVSLFVGIAITERSKIQVELAVERVRRGEYQVRAELSEKLIQLNQSLAKTNTSLEESHREKDELLQREQNARSEAEKANRLKDEFLAVLSHELRTPLNPILGWATLLKRSNLDEATKMRGIETIERNAKLQIQLIEDLLDVSRIQQGKINLNIQPVDLTNTILEAQETVRLAREAKNIGLETILDHNIGVVAGDAARLQQIIWNLLANAVKFTPNEGRIQVILQQINNYAQVQVKDNGKGISAEFLPYVFDYFRQADGTLTRQFGGLGLGLAIVKHLTELHGGTVTASSEGEGKGATFTVRLPLISDRPQIIPKDGESNCNFSLLGSSILVVDDDIDTGDFLTYILSQSGAKVTAVTSAGEALEMIAKFPVDLLLSDIGMPGIDGYTLMRLIRAMPLEKGGEIPAIALTAYAGEINQQQALDAGFQKHLVKPIETDILFQAISEVLALT